MKGVPIPTLVAFVSNCDTTSNQGVGARDSENTAYATGERRRAAGNKHNSTESTSSSPVRAVRARSRASGKQCVAASRNQLPERVHGFEQPKPGTAALQQHLFYVF